MRTRVLFLSFFLAAIAALESAAQVVSIPDTNFLIALIGPYGTVDLNNNDTIEVAEALAVTDLDVSYDGIYDLTGIEAFTNLSSLNCSSNNLNKVDLSKNTKLVTLDCSFNIIQNLDISNNIVLRALNCSNNLLAGLDLSKSVLLTKLDCSFNQIAQLDVSKDTALISLYSNSNLLSSLALSANSMLANLDCSTNQLVQLDVSKNRALTYMTCENNQLITLDVSNDTSLLYFDCSFNKLSSLNVSKNTALTTLLCAGNSFSSLDVSMDTSIYYLDCSLDSLLSFICVHDISLAESNFTKDSTAEWRNCTAPTGIFEMNLASPSLVVYPNPSRDMVYIQGKVGYVELFNSTGQEVFQGNSGSIDLSTLPVGVYQIRLTDENNHTYRQKLVKE
jgi:hypothetical protein